MKEGETVWTNHKQQEPPLKPRCQWEAWYKKQGNAGWQAHAEWRRRNGIIRTDANGTPLGRIE